MVAAHLFGQYAAVQLVDFEFYQPDGERPVPLCMVAWELHSGRTIRLSAYELEEMSAPPFSVGPDTLFVANYASAELNCFLELGWPMPVRVLDLFAEFRGMTNGLPVPCGNGLLGALAYFGIDGMGAVEKKGMRELAMRGSPYSDTEIAALLAYCESDVLALEKLFHKMAPRIDLPRALLRGRYMAAAARIERTGAPMDVELLDRLRANWPDIQDRLIAEVDRDYGVYDGRVFKLDRWAAYLAANGITWPRHDSGSLDLRDDTFSGMAKRFSVVAPMRELRHTLSQLRLLSLPVGSDGRNRCLLSVFRARTSRNQPSNSRFIFGPSAWLRGLIKPSRNRAAAYIDWEQQEFE